MSFSRSNPQWAHLSCSCYVWLDVCMCVRKCVCVQMHFESMTFCPSFVLHSLFFHCHKWIKMLLCNLTKAPLLTAYNLIVVVFYRHYFETIFTHLSHATIISQVHVRESKKNTYKRDIFIHLCKNPHTHTHTQPAPHTYRI